MEMHFLDTAMRAVRHWRNDAICVRVGLFPGATLADRIADHGITERRNVHRVRIISTRGKTEFQYFGIQTITGMIANKRPTWMFGAADVKWQFSDW